MARTGARVSVGVASFIGFLRPKTTVEVNAADENDERDEGDRRTEINDGRVLGIGRTQANDREPEKQRGAGHDDRASR